MLTRLEVDGFKNLVGFSADFGPFTCIAGENGIGKSNLFDVIELLSLLADKPLMEAAQHVRGAEKGMSAPTSVISSGAVARPARTRCDWPPK
jgi:AAA15 family ATPase/GTPase